MKIQDWQDFLFASYPNGQRENPKYKFTIFKLLYPWLIHLGFIDYRLFLSFQDRISRHKL